MIVLDSSFLIGFYNERDVHHQAASSLMDRFLAGAWGRGLLLEYVFLETESVLLMRRDLSVAVRVGRILLDAGELDFVPGSDLFLDSWDCFCNQRRTRLSFVDAAVANAARKRADGQLLSFDGEFRKVAGLHVNPQ
ncbi:MAG: PIN domain-containing protein [Terriglobales bacterium]|jgi:predicted nucleic acid-binding protein